MCRREHGLTPIRRRIGRGRSDRVQHRDGADRHGELGHAGGVERGDQQRDHLGVGRRALLADKLDAGLRELPSLTAQRLVLAKDLGGVAEAVRASDVAQPTRDEARDRHRHVGSQREKPAVEVDEAKRGAFERTGCGFERGEVLGDGRLDEAVAP